MLSKIYWFTPTWDMIAVLFLIAGAFLLGLTLGRNRIIIILISIYIAITVISFFPLEDTFKKTLSANDSFIYQIVVFIVAILLFYIFLSKSILKKVLRKTGNRSVFLVFFLSLFCMGLFLSVSLSFFPKELVRTFNPLTQSIFMAKFSRFLWAIMPVVIMAFMQSKKRKYNKSY